MTQVFTEFHKRLLSMSVVIIKWTAAHSDCTLRWTPWNHNTSPPHSLISIKTRLIFCSSPELVSHNVTGMVSEHPTGTKPSYLKGFLWVPTHTDARGAQSERNAFISIQVPHPVVQEEDKSRIKTSAKEIKLITRVAWFALTALVRGHTDYWAWYSAFISNHL